MSAVDIMMIEHRTIERLLVVMRKVCYGVMQGEAICYDDFEKMIDFIRIYADEHHHGKEEKYLFNQMIIHLGSLGEKLIKAGMFVEHDLGRLYIKELEVAIERVKAGDDESRLDIIANAIGYTHLLERHIAKEDELVYPFAMNKLPQEVIKEVEEACLLFEKQAEQKGVQEQYLKLLSELEEKYK